MSLSKTPTGERLYKSALIGAGLLGVFLWRKEVLPKYMGIISIGAASFGLCFYVLNILKGEKKRSHIDFCPVDTYYDEIASQVNKELSQEGNQSGVIRGHSVGESEKLDPVAYLKSGTKISEDHKRKEQCHGNFLKTWADRFIWKESSGSGTEIDKITSEDPLELPLSEDEDEPSINEMEVEKKGITLNLAKTKLDLLRDVIAESKSQSSQSIPGLLKEFDSIYSEAEKEISGIKWTKKGRSRKVLGVGRSKAPKK